MRTLLAVLLFANAAMTATGGRLTDPASGIVCPLRHTSVNAAISGFVARVNVTQEFENTSGKSIEAVYTFPLPDRAAVDEMTMTIGDRTVRSRIKTREDAQALYEKARRAGHTASLLDQEKPNIFTQSVTNIGPKMKVRIRIGYVETLRYEAGSYEFAFPMVVGPRYIPAGLPRAGKIQPPSVYPLARAGHDISLEVNLDAGMPVEEIRSATHSIGVERPSAEKARITLENRAEIPNRDFILTYRASGAEIRDSVLVHRNERSGYFSLVLQPPARVASTAIQPKELVFVVDTSGSMSGFPLDKCKELIWLSLNGLHPRDTFNLITFSGDTEILFPAPVRATRENVDAARRFLLSRSGQGGTEMMKAIRAALAPSTQRDHLRVVVFLTDGYVGNDMEIVGEIAKHPNARVFGFGIGSSVNRFLLDRMADAGRGEVEYVGIADQGDAAHAAQRLYERVRNPILTDISIDWNGLPVVEVLPGRMRDLFADRPLVVHGRYSRAGRGTIRLKGRSGGREIVREIPVTLPESAPSHVVLAPVWARAKVEDLMSRDWAAIQNGSPAAGVKSEIVRLGLAYRLMTQFTSFVAVEERRKVEGGRPVLVEVPVETPYGVEPQVSFDRSLALMGVVGGVPGGAVGGVIGGIRIGGNIGAASRAPLPAALYPPPPPPAQVPSPSSKLEPALGAVALSGNGNGLISVRVWLVQESAPILAELRKAGLEITVSSGTGIVRGRVKPADLPRIVAMTAVVFLSRDLGEP